MENNSFYSSQGTQQRSRQRQAAFGEFEASELYCATCGKAVPVNKFLLLILPEGDKYEYRCRFCGTNVGKKTDQSGQFYDVLKGKNP